MFLRSFPLSDWTKLNVSFLAARSMKELGGLNKLTTRDLNSNDVTGVGLKELAVLKNLTTLDLSGTGIKASECEELQKALPKCKIVK